MMEEKYERMLESARGLMAMAEDPGASLDECAIAWGRALLLLAKYVKEDRRLSSEGRLNGPVVRRTVDVQPGSMSLRKAHLAGVVARGNRADVYNTERKAGNGRTVVESITFCGTERACLEAELIWTSMETNRVWAWRRDAGCHWVKDDADWRDSYYEGFACRVYDRYQELRRDQGEAGSIAGAGNVPVRVRGARAAGSMRGLDLREADPPDARFRLDADALREGAHAAADVYLSMDELHRQIRQIESKEA